MCFVPILRDRLRGYFVIEPVDTHQVHAGVPGKVLAIYVKEGDRVHSGQPLARLTSLQEASAREEATAQAALSQAKVFSAELQHAGLGDALTAQQSAQRNHLIAAEQTAQLAVTAPVDGVVTTRNPESLLHRDVTTGEPLITIIDPSRLVARLYIPASEMDRIHAGDTVALQPPFAFSEIHTRLGVIDGVAVPLPTGLLEQQDYQGITLPAFYSARIPLQAGQEGLRAGMSGPIKIFGRRRSLANRVWTMVSELVRTHFW